MKIKSLKSVTLVLIVTLIIWTVIPLDVKADELFSSEKGYTLKQVIVLSRHNIRSPLSAKGSVLEKVTPYKWYDWSAGASELSLRGGILETEMGQYFRKWMVSEGLIPENYRPEGSEIRFYSNSKQRTIATAKYFSAGFLPVSNMDIEYHMDFDKMDPVFTPAINFTSDEYVKDATEQIIEIYGDSLKSLSDNYSLLADVIDIEGSEEYKDYTFTEDPCFSFDTGEEPKVTGSLKLATQISDALVLQYYEEADEKKAAFGNNLANSEWEDISEIKDLYGDVLFTAPMVAVNVAYPLIKEIYSEMQVKDRIFTFLCGHDSNVGSVLAALGVKEYELPDTIEKKTPIGCKVVFSKWENENGKLFWSADMIYQTTDQLKTQPIIDLQNSPSVYHLSFDGIKRNKDGLYKAKDFIKLFKNSMKEYTSLYEKYCDTVSFLGPEGTYTQEACEIFFGKEKNLIACKTVNDAIKALTDKKVKYAVIPQENTIGGAVTDYVDSLLAEKDVSIVGEVELPISQNLLVRPGTELSDIKTVYSHKQGIAQGKEWLEKNLPEAEVIEVSSTAEGAKIVSGEKDKTCAAIASAGCADVYGLEILAGGIQNNENNKTRFYVLSLEKPSKKAGDRLVFAAKGDAEYLPSLVSKMEKQGIKLVFIHDRPLKTVLGEYNYIIECENLSFKKYLKLIKNNSLEFRYLGSFNVK